MLPAHCGEGNSTANGNCLKNQERNQAADVPLIFDVSGTQALRMKQLAFDFAAPTLPTLDNFVHGRNGELLQQLKRAAAGAGGERFIYLWGQPGSGRSHLLRGVVAEVHRAGASAAYIPCAPGTPLQEGLERVDCVALDQVDRLDAEGQASAFHLFNALRERGAALVASGPAPPARLSLREDLVTRLGWGLVYQVHALSDEEKLKALADHASLRGFPLQEDVGSYLLTRVRRDLPSLLAMIDALDRYSLETKRAVTVPLLRELLLAAGGPGPASGVEDRGNGE